MKYRSVQNQTWSENDTGVTIAFEDNSSARSLFGEQNKHLQQIAATLNIEIYARGNTVTIHGDATTTEFATRLLKDLYGLLEEGYPIYSSDIDHAIHILGSGHNVRLKDIFLDTIYITSRKRPITPKGVAQKQYIDAIRRNDIVLGIGPAGTGKTYLAMAMAVSYLSKEYVNRIVLTRPAIEAGESLGFLPGDLYEKINPYLRPLYDALHDMMRYEQASQLIQQGAIEVAPLAFMRGRTLNDSFVILDEAQNTTSEQMKMFLTRLGFSSKAVITGDITQIDLPNGKASGLVEAKEILQGIKGISFVFFSKKDVVRHKLVRDIIKAYEDFEEKREKNR